MATEDKFPTIRELRDTLSSLVELGLGDLPTQVTVVPASTILAVARATNPGTEVGNAPLMIEFGPGGESFSPVMVSCDYLGDKRGIYPLSRVN